MKQFVKVFKVVIAILLLEACASSPDRSSSASTKQLKLICTTGLARAMEAIAPEYEKKTGVKLNLIKVPTNMVKTRVLSSETFDVVIGASSLMNDLSQKLVGERVDVAKVGIGAAVRKGASLPEIKTVEQFKKVLVAARSITYVDPATGASSGVYIDKLLKELGIYKAVKPKAVLVGSGGKGAEAVAVGKVELVITQMSELNTTEGIVLVGPIPEEIQSYTMFTASAAAGTSHLEEVATLVKFLTSEEASKIYTSNAMNPAK
jgi:molybdate transport system substrate-binding protein